MPGEPLRTVVTTAGTVTNGDILRMMIQAVGIRLGKVTCELVET